ncbi:MAG: hypothetical protein Kow00124_16390 [Anaerolineae bacterium]
MESPDPRKMTLRIARSQLPVELDDDQFTTVPRGLTPEERAARPHWRILFEMQGASMPPFGLDLYGEVVFGRDGFDPDFYDLSPYGAAVRGVSRRHAALRVTNTRLYVVDLGSTNGTWRNGQSIGQNTPYSLMNGDVLGFGALSFKVHIIDRPEIDSSLLTRKADLADALALTARAITAQLDIDEVLIQVASMSMSLTGADVTAIWLIDQQTGAVHLEGQRGMQPHELDAMATIEVDSPVIEVIESGRPLLHNREEEVPVKLKTGYLVDAALLVPIALGGVTFGVLGAMQRTGGRRFTERDEQTLSTVADFTAIAVQNARVFQATDRALARRVEELTALNEIARALASTLDLSALHDICLGSIRRLWDVEQVMVWLADHRSGELQPFRVPANLPLARHAEVPELIKEVAQTRRPARRDLTKMMGEADKESTIRVDAISLACLPLVSKDRAIGALLLVRRQHGAFTDSEMARLEAIAHPVAAAFQNAILFQQVQREQAIVEATASMLDQPLLILGEDGDLVVSNQAAQTLFERHMAPLFEAINGHVGRTIEIDLDGESYLLSAANKPGLGTIVLMHNITYLKRLEHTRLEFVQTLTHDLRSPLTSIRTYAHLIARREQLSEKSQHYLDTIIAATGSMAALVDQLLDIALLSEDAIAPPEPCDLAEVAIEAIRDLGGAAARKSTAVTLSVHGQPCPVNCDRRRIYRVMLNLLDNAIKYSPEEAKVEMRLSYHLDRVEIVVQDNGPGIPAEDLPHLFEKYFRGRQAKGDVEGSGLGLVMVAATVKAHGGQVWAENAPEGGARFTVTLPPGSKAPVAARP